MALALSEIWVTSGNTIPPQGMAPYMRLLTQDAFANYRTIMFDVTLSPAMGRFLDMVNNDKPNVAANTHANENYARELMQLFTLGLYLLNQDGSLQLDSSGNPIPTYDQNAGPVLCPRIHRLDLSHRARQHTANSQSAVLDRPDGGFREQS